MNLNQQPTCQQLARLLATRKDHLDDHLLWVSQTGEVRLDRLPPNLLDADIESHLPSMRVRMPAYRRGQGFVGKRAAADEQFVARLLDTLQNAWPSACDGGRAMRVER